MRLLENKNAIITGSNRGLGSATLEELARNGCNIWAHARKQTQEFEKYISCVAQENEVEIRPVYFDMQNKQNIKEAVKTIMSEKKNIDILVNNAGIGMSRTFSMTKMEELEQLFEINVFAPMYLTQLVMRNMVKNRNGSIINLGSVQGLDSSALNCAYGPSKAALISFTKCLASEVAPLGLRVNAVAPGGIDTEILNSLTEEERSYLINKSAMGRLGEKSEVAKTIVFLASDESSFINGQVIRIDGGAK